MSRLIWNTRSAFPNYSYITVSKVIIPRRSIFKTTNSCAFSSSSTVAKEEDEHTALTREKVGNDTFREVLEEKKVNNDISMYRNVFKYKTTFEIVRALFVFRLCANQTLVRHSPKVSFLVLLFAKNWKENFISNQVLFDCSQLALA